MDLSASFDTVAELYNANRRGYPAPLYADLAAITGLGRQDAILEIGCGSGQATQGLVDLTDDVLALDPGAQLLNLARRRLSGQPGVEYANCSFEDWSLIEGRFRLVVSAQAWHWLDPRIAYEKAAAALVPDGWLAIFGHVPMPPTGQIGEDLRVAHARYAPPGYDGPSPESWYLPTGPVAGLITASALFGPVIHRGYGFQVDHSPQSLIAHCATISYYTVLPTVQRDALFDALAQVVADHGGRYQLTYQTHLYLAPLL